MCFPRPTPPKKNQLTQNPSPSNGKFCRICLFSKIPPPRSPTLFSSCYDWCLNCPGHTDSRCWRPVTSFHCFQTQDGRAEPLEMCPTHIFTEFLILTFICFQFSYMSSALKQALWPYRCTDCNPSSNTQNDAPVPHPIISYRKKIKKNSSSNNPLCHQSIWLEEIYSNARRTWYDTFFHAANAH